MNIAVTSASGQLGAAIIKYLKAQIGKDHVIGIARTPKKAQHLGVEIRQGDYNSREQFDSALQGVDVVLLVSGMDAPDARIQQHRNVIDAAKHNGVKKIVYTSIVGDADKTAFAPVVKSNRQTELDIQASGLQWAIGRNGIYIEPDLEYIDNYVKDGVIRNCAGDGKCGYTSRAELAFAYAQMLIDSRHDGEIYTLAGKSISQTQLAELINDVYATKLSYTAVSVDDYKNERTAALGDFIGTVIAGIYEGIRIGVNDIPSDYAKAAGRPHQSPIEMIAAVKSELSR